MARHFRFLAALLPFVALFGALLTYFGGVARVLPASLSLHFRSLVFLVSTLALGPGLLVSGIFKEHVHRPRPVHVQEFGGTAPFRPVFRLDGACAKNCSFPSGETAAAFWMMAPAALAPPPLRGLALGIAILFGCATGALRMAAGGHFLSDILFSGWLMGAVISIGFWILRRPRPLDDDDFG